MIRSAKAFVMVLALSCAAFAQTPSGTAGAPDADKADAYYHFAMGRLYAEMAASDGGHPARTNTSPRPSTTTSKRLSSIPRRT